jgi:hypothetical protein
MDHPRSSSMMQPTAGSSGTYRIRQLIWGDGSYQSLQGMSRGFDREAPGLPPFECNGQIQGYDRMRVINAACGGHNGVTNRFAPPILSRFRIEEIEGFATVTITYGTPYPSVEIWQYD